MANPTTNYSWPMPTTTDLVTDLPADFAAFGQPVDTSLKALNPETTLGDISFRSSTSNTNTRLGIGTAGQVLAVSGGVPAWTTTADVTPLTTKGDLFTFTTVDARLGVGANNTVLTADSAEASGLKWATPSSVADNWTALSSTTFSASSAVNVNSVFTSAYDNYKIIVNFTAVSADALVQLRLRVSGTDSSTNYANQRLQQSGSTVSGSSNPDSSTTFFWLGYAASPVAEVLIDANLYKPFLASPTMYECTEMHGNDQSRITGKNTASTSYDGFTIFSTSTLTGTVRVFAFKNS